MAGIPEGPEIGRRLEAALKLRLDGGAGRRPRRGVGPVCVPLHWRFREGMKSGRARLRPARRRTCAVHHAAQGNLSSVGGDGAEHGLRAREHLREGLERGGWCVATRSTAPGSAVGGCSQERTGRSRAARGGSRDSRGRRLDRQPHVEADGHAPALRGMGAVVLTADCIPVVLGCRGER